MAFRPAHIEFLRKVCKALGIDPDSRSVCKVVIEIGVKEIVKVHVQEYVDEQAGDPLAQLLAETRPDAEVITTDRPVTVDALGKVRIE